jgi:ketosteroid isomerase-like protein
MSKNIETIQNLYAAFGRVDIPTILAMYADNIQWEYQPISTDVPWLQRRTGKADAIKFFEVLGKEMDIKKFDVKAVTETGNLVIAIVDIEFVVKRTGKTVSEVDEVHLFHFDDAGKIARFRHVPDTHQHWTAWKA